MGRSGHGCACLCGGILAGASFHDGTLIPGGRCAIRRDHAINVIRATAQSVCTVGSQFRISAHGCPANPVPPARSQVAGAVRLAVHADSSRLPPSATAAIQLFPRKTPQKRVSTIGIPREKARSCLSWDYRKQNIIRICISLANEGLNSLQQANQPDLRL